MNNKQTLRMCVVCKQMIDKKDLIRIVKNKFGELSIDLTGKLAGRGAYVCKNPECLVKLQKNKILNKSFKCVVPENIYEELQIICEETK